MGGLVTKKNLVKTVFILLTVSVGLYGCDTPEVPAVCISNDDCIVGEYCEKEAGQCGNAGECVLIPDVCTDDWTPVCGCDGQTYGNFCSAAAKGISVDYEGECESNCCIDSCGDGICFSYDCTECGCPCLETPANCPQDCSSIGLVCCETFGYGAEMVKCCETYEWVPEGACYVPPAYVGGGKQVVDDSYCMEQ